MRSTTPWVIWLLVPLFACSGAEKLSDDDTRAPVSEQDVTQQLVGSWEGQNETRGSMSFQFAPDQTATWTVDLPSGPETMRITYVAVAREGQVLLDLSGFETGPLVGMVMYGLVEFEGENIIRMDLEPGPPGDDGPRPEGLASPDALTLERKEASR